MIEFIEVKDILKVPYTEEQRINFIVKNNHKCSYTIYEINNVLLEAYGQAHTSCFCYL